MISENAAQMFAEALSALLEIKHEELLAYVLRGVAVVAQRQGRWSRAARLIAAAEALREMHGLAEWPFVRWSYGCGPEGFATNWLS